MNFNYQMRFAKTGRARFIAHLDTLSVLVRAVRRTGYQLAFTEGMRPKPLLSLALPLGVGVEGEDEICDFSLRQRVPLSEFSRRLNQELPEGIRLKSFSPSYESKSASRVTGASYRVRLANPGEDWQEAAAAYSRENDLVVLRHRPKGDKEVNVKKYVKSVNIADDGSARFEMLVTSEGTARPEEVISLLEKFAGRKMEAVRVVRTGITLGEKRPPAPAGKRRRLRR
ncbi:MAG: TIGR03936 family radical SAM-associated protein [Actinobacteria bacterium]|nr:TIGR03936 family radical SAM-associated protein [Actinomycetota bacterium]